MVHFDGHGTTIQDEGGVGALWFETSDGGLDRVRAERFGDLMNGFHVPFVVLEACRTATKMPAHDTVASALVRQSVGTVLAMGYAVHVDMTREFMAAFYEAVASGSAKPCKRPARQCTPTRAGGLASARKPPQLSSSIGSSRMGVSKRGSIFAC